jgi:hypothetical protein
MTTLPNSSTANHLQRPSTLIPMLIPLRNLLHQSLLWTGTETPTLPVVVLVLAVLLVAMPVEAIEALVTAAGHLLPGDLLTLQLSVENFYFLPCRAYITQQAPNPSNVLGVFGLSIRTQERDLDEEFSRFGRVEKVTIVYDQRVSFISITSLSPTHILWSSPTVPEGLVSSGWQQLKMPRDVFRSSMASYVILRFPCWPF